MKKVSSAVCIRNFTTAGIAASKGLPSGGDNSPPCCSRFGIAEKRTHDW